MFYWMCDVRCVRLGWKNSRIEWRWPCIIRYWQCAKQQNISEEKKDNSWMRMTSRNNDQTRERERNSATHRNGPFSGGTVPQTILDISPSTIWLCRCKRRQRMRARGSEWSIWGQFIWFYILTSSDKGFAVFSKWLNIRIELRKPVSATIFNYSIVHRHIKSA